MKIKLELTATFLLRKLSRLNGCDLKQQLHKSGF